MKKSYKFKDVDLIFDFKKLASYDQEYLRTMFYETVLDRSVKHSGRNFSEYFPCASTFALFDDETSMKRYMGEFSYPYANTASHRLQGKKYYLAWTYEQV
jgi:hypothetical protein|tara:strand:- start:467 stop:766 length:300 start_codon:yes stop_codon:yes gene_type:complete